LGTTAWREQSTLLDAQQVNTRSKKVHGALKIVKIAQQVRTVEPKITRLCHVQRATGVRPVQKNRALAGLGLTTILSAKQTQQLAQHVPLALTATRPVFQTGKLISVLLATIVQMPDLHIPRARLLALLELTQIPKVQIVCRTVLNARQAFSAKKPVLFQSHAEMAPSVLLEQLPLLIANQDSIVQLSPVLRT
jgi:hypothetical protein